MSVKLHARRLSRDLCDFDQSVFDVAVLVLIFISIILVALISSLVQCNVAVFEVWLFFGYLCLVIEYTTVGYIN